MVRRHRLGGEDVHRCPGERAVPERLGHRRLVDDAPAGAVHEVATPAHHLQLGAPDEVPGAVGQRDVERDDVRAPEELVQGDDLRPGPAGRLDRMRVVGDDGGAEGDAALGNELPDAPEAEQPHRLPEQLVPSGEPLLLPPAGLGGGDRRDQVPEQGEHQAEGQLGHGDRVAARRVHHHHALPGGGLDVDVVHADAGATDELQAAGLLQHVRGDLGGAPDCKHLVLTEDGLQRRRRQADLRVHGELGRAAQDLQTFGRQLVRDQDLHRRVLRWEIREDLASRGPSLQSAERAL